MTGFTERVGSFFKGLTGLLTATTALIAAVTGILVATHVIGGSSDSSAPSQPKASWAAQANAICADTNDTENALPQPNGLSPSEAAKYLNSSVQLQRQLLRKLTALEPPRGSEAQVTAFLRMGSQLNEAMDDVYVDVSAGKVGGLIADAKRLGRLNRQFNAAATALGATTCAEGSTPAALFG